MVSKKLGSGPLGSGCCTVGAGSSGGQRRIMVELAEQKSRLLKMEHW
jgi:hypothetical protein